MTTDLLRRILEVTFFPCEPDKGIVVTEWHWYECVLSTPRYRFVKIVCVTSFEICISMTEPLQSIYMTDSVSQVFMWRWHRSKSRRGFLLWFHINLETLELWCRHGRLLHEYFDLIFCSSWINSSLSTFKVACWSTFASIPTLFLLETSYCTLYLRGLNLFASSSIYNVWSK